MEKEEIKDLSKVMLIYTSAFSKYADYISKVSYYEINMEYRKAHLDNITNVIEEGIPIEVICLKLVHDMGMIYKYAEYMLNTIGGNIQTGGMKPNLYIKLSVGSENIDIAKRKGFGLIGYNPDDMLKILFDTNSAIIDFLDKLISENDYYREFKMITDNYMTYCYSDVDSAIVEIISKNIEVYEKYLDTE